MKYAQMQVVDYGHRLCDGLDLFIPSADTDIS